MYLAPYSKTGNGQTAFPISLLRRMYIRERVGVTVMAVGFSLSRFGKAESLFCVFILS